MDGADGPNNPRDIDIWNVILSFQESVDLILRYLWSKLHLLVCNDEVGSLHITELNAIHCKSLKDCGKIIAVVILIQLPR